MSKFTVRHLCIAGVTAALYTALTLLAASMNLAYLGVQFRISEAMCVLPFLFPETVWGLFVGCLLSNIISPYGIPDMVVGSIATLLAAYLTSRCRSRYLAPLPPVVCNGILVGAVIAWQEAGSTAAFWPAFALNGLSVAFGEAVICYVLGLSLLRGLERVPALASMGRKI